MLAAGAVLALVVAGCGGSDADTTDTSARNPPVTTPTEVSTGSDTTQNPTDTAAPGSQTVTVYFMNDAATALIAEERTVEASSALRAAMVALADGPVGADGMRALPTGTEIIGTDVRGDAAYVNLSAVFADGYPTGGSSAEAAVLAPLVYTATQAADVDRVYVTIDGVTTVPAGSQFDWAGGFTRADFHNFSISGG